ncbi:HAD-like protein [Meira miltonrushii]|uniref:HAD-like protein n=1 Tax=Meira miltonrushii TaxID=1280837 RepID=A0A316V6I4_9BASI|nr:HAD-like protein [Meira miltonrushii]PWN33032.1 HAD-like protein [Meira miltonrushii]
MTVKTIEVDAVLFDMDGTLIDSTPAVNATWGEIAIKYGLDYDYVLQTCHGWRTVENLKRFIPSIPDEQLPEEVKAFEGRISQIAEDAKKNGKQEGQIVAMPGAVSLLDEICSGQKEDPKRRAGWAIVTSATKAYAQLGFASANVAPPPNVFITSDLCSKGKPDPEPYLLGAKHLNVDIKRCLVVEDAPPGVESGKSAGAKVLGLKTTHDGNRMWQKGADFVVEDLSKVHARWQGDQLFIDIDSEQSPLHTNGNSNGHNGA